jgi:hypothetical protein
VRSQLWRGARKAESLRPLLLPVARWMRRLHAHLVCVCAAAPCACFPVGTLPCSPLPPSPAARLSRTWTRWAFSASSTPSVISTQTFPRARSVPPLPAVSWGGRDVWLRGGVGRRGPRRAIS